MTALERRCRFLLHVYPAAYRRDRAEEMLGTLLDTTPQGRTWPLPRDTRALLLGGLRVRSGQGRRLSVPGNLRLAALLGCTLFLTSAAVDYVTYGLVLSPRPAPAPLRVVVSWPDMTVVALILTAAVLPWLAGRKVVALGAVAAGTATVAYDLSAQFPWRGFSVPPHSPAAVTAAALLGVLLPLAGLVLLARGTERPPRLWLWLPALLVALAAPVEIHAMADFLSLQPNPSGPDAYLWLVPFGVAIAWIGFDARPAVGLAAYLSLWLGQALVNRFYLGAWNVNWGWFAQANWWVTSANWWGQSWKWLAVLLVLTVLALRLLRRQAVL
jgi:hypothetical protein